jgi:hypothetical protein
MKNNFNLITMNTLITNKNLTTVNFAVVSYFILIGVANSYNINFVLFGIVKELFTIPFLVAQFVFLAIGIKYLMYHQIDLLTLFSIISLAICAIITISSFF